MEHRKCHSEKQAEEGWSRNVLVLQIESKAYERSGKSVNNFDIALPLGKSDMVTQIFKDPYLFMKNKELLLDLVTK